MLEAPTYPSVTAEKHKQPSLLARTLTQVGEVPRVRLTPQAFRAALQSRGHVLRAFSAFEYSNVRPFNPKFSDGLVNPDRIVM